MITPRILFTDVAAAAPWVGLAKQLGRQTYDAGIISKTFSVADGVKITVNNVITKGLGGICKVWIEAGGGFIYQFYNTKTPVHIVGGGNVIGSAVAVALPILPYLDSPAFPSKVDIIKKMRFIATGSTIEDIIKIPPAENTPAKEPTNNGMGDCFLAKNLYQMQGQMEPVFHAYGNENAKQQVSVKKSLSYSWSGDVGVPYSYGMHMPTEYVALTDVMYDLPPTSTRKGLNRWRAPDADWPNEAALFVATSEDYGPRTFVIMVDASSKFYCWPLSVYEETQFDSPIYADQYYKANVRPEFSKMVDPPLPAWVKRNTTEFRDQWIADEGILSQDPRYSWRFRADGKRVAAIVLERTDDELIYRGKATASAPVTEFGPFLIEAKSRVDPENLSTSPVLTDVLGWVEFDLDITITGEELESFNFTVLLRGSEKAVENSPVAVGYISPIEGGWARREVAVTPGDLVLAEVSIYQTPELVNLQRGLGGATHLNLAEFALFTITNKTTSAIIYQRCIKNSDCEYPAGYEEEDDDYIRFSARLNSIDLRFLSFSWTLLSVNEKKSTTAEWSGIAGIVDIRVSAIPVSQEIQFVHQTVVMGKVVNTLIRGPEFNAVSSFETTVVDETLVKVMISDRATWWTLTEPWWQIRTKFQFTAMSVDSGVFFNSMSTTLSAFQANEAVELLARCGGHSGLAEENVDYVDTDWNSYIVPIIFKDVQAMQAMYAAGDWPTAPGQTLNEVELGITAMGVQQYRSSKEYDIAAYNAYFGHVRNFPIGAATHANIIGTLMSSPARDALCVDPRGWYSHYYGTRVWLTRPINVLRLCVTQNSGKIIFGRIPNVQYGIALAGYTVYDIMVGSQGLTASDFEYITVDLLNHIKYEDTGALITHKEMYNLAYKNNDPVSDETYYPDTVFITEDSHIPQVHFYQLVNIDGTIYFDEQYLYLSPLEFTALPLNESFIPHPALSPLFF